MCVYISINACIKVRSGQKSTWKTDVEWKKNVRDYFSITLHRHQFIHMSFGKCLQNPCCRVMSQLLLGYAFFGNFWFSVVNIVEKPC